MQRISSTAIRDDLAEIINRVTYGGERIILNRRGRDMAVIVSLKDAALLEKLENRADVMAATKARKEKGAVPLAKIKARLKMK